MRGVRTFLSVGPFWWTTLQFPNTQIHKYTTLLVHKYKHSKDWHCMKVRTCLSVGPFASFHWATFCSLVHGSKPHSWTFLMNNLTISKFTNTHLPWTTFYSVVHGRKLHQKGFSDSRFHEQTTAKGCNIQQRRNTQKAPGVCNCVSPVLNIIAQAIQDQSCQVLKPIIKIVFLWINFCKMKSKSNLDINWEV